MNYVSVPGVGRQYKVKTQPTFTRDSIMSAVCELHNVTSEVLRGKKQNRPIVYPRQMAMYLMYTYAGMTLKEIGEYFSRDHTTSIHSRQAIQDLLDVDEKVKDDLNVIVSRITESSSALAAPAPSNGTANKC